MLTVVKKEEECIYIFQHTFLVVAIYNSTCSSDKIRIPNNYYSKGFKRMSLFLLSTYVTVRSSLTIKDGIFCSKVTQTPN